MTTRMPLQVYEAIAVLGVEALAEYLVAEIQEEIGRAHV